MQIDNLSKYLSKQEMNDLVEHYKLHFLDFINKKESIEDDNTKKSSSSIFKIF